MRTGPNPQAARTVESDAGRLDPAGRATALELRRAARTYRAVFAWSGVGEAVPAPALLHANELAYYRDLRAEARRRSFLLGRLAAKRALAGYFGHPCGADLEIVAGVFGQPLVRSALPEHAAISISHSGEFGCAVAFPEEHPMAIDLERIDAASVAVIKEQLTAREVAGAGEAAAEPAHFTALWSAREALSKILRCGMTCDAHVLELADIVAVEGGLAGAYRHFGQYRFRCWIWSDYVLSMALPKNTIVAGGITAPHGRDDVHAPQATF